MVEVPTPTMVITFLEIVATDKSELVYVKPPLLTVVGGVIVNGSLPNAFSGTENQLIVFAERFTTRDAVIVADVLFSVLA